MVRAALRELSAAHRTERGDTRLGVVLAAVAGGVNAAGFLAVGAFTSHMSGMVAQMAEFTVMHQWRAVALLAFSVTAFFTGSLIASLLINWARLKHLHSEFALPLMLEAVLLVTFGLLAAASLAYGLTGLNGLVSLLCLIMGLQNGLITKISHAEIRTTHMTGVITDLGIEAGRFLFGRAAHADTRFNPAKTRRLALLLAGFVIGGIAGASAFRIAGPVCVFLFAAILAVMALLPIKDDLSRLFSPRRDRST